MGELEGVRQKVPQYLLTHSSALLGMKLRGVEVILVHRRAERQDVLRHSRRVLADRHIVAVDEIDENSPLPAPPLGACLEKRRSDGRRGTPPKGERRGGLYCVPPHVRYLVLVSLWHKALHLCVEDAEAIYIALFRMTAHQLLTDADAEDRLREGTNHLVKPTLPEVVHRVACFALTGEDDSVRASQLLWRVGQQRFHTHPLQGMNDGKDVPGIVFHYGNLHLTSTI